MTLDLVRYVELPEHTRPGGFDHASVDRHSGRLYVAHTANDALDVIDCAADRYLHSVGGLTGVAGVLVSDERGLVFTSNRGENTVGIFAVVGEGDLVKVPVGLKPNGLAYDSTRNLLLAANVGDPAVLDSFTVSIVSVERRAMIASVPVPGRTRWTLFDPQTDAFYVNIADPPQIVVIDAGEPTRVAHTLEVPAAGPHGLDLDPASRRLFCACDGGQLVVLDVRSGSVLDSAKLSGVPDVIFFNAALKRLYVAVGDPGVMDVFDTDSMQHLEVVNTEKGAHTLGFDAGRNKVYAFLPRTHRAAVYVDRG